LDSCFSSCEKLGLAAEHGYFYRWGIIYLFFDKNKFWVVVYS
jgi:hypothetical protein